MPEPDARVSSVVDAGQLIDAHGWGTYQAWLIGLTALAVVFDGIDNQLLGVALPTMMRDWDLPRMAFAPVISVGYVGMMIGGAGAGIAGDRFGRRAALIGCVAIFGVMTLATASVDSVWTLAGLRFVSGIGLGGAMPNAATLAAEYVPRASRPLAVTIAIVCMPLGATIAGLLGSFALTTLGWRTLFVVGGVTPILLAAALTRMLPESPRYLVSRPDRWPELARLLTRMGHTVAADAVFSRAAETGVVQVPVREVLHGAARRDTVALWLSFFSCMLAVYLGFSWLPSLMSGAGFQPDAASSAITFFNLGGVVGAIAGGVVIARVGSRNAMLTMTAGSIVGALVLTFMTIGPGGSVATIFVTLAVTGGLINAVQTTMYALATHVYQSAVRATGVGAAVAVGRLGAILSGYAGAWALDYRGTQSFFGLMALTMGVCFVALAGIRRHVPATGKARGRF